MFQGTFLYISTDIDSISTFFLN